jgi:hypothetical protein
MKVTTEDCVKAIVEHLIQKEHNFTNAKDWKRISKTGTGDNIIRKFQNKVSNREIYVRSSDSEIFEVSDKEFGMVTSFKKFSSLTSDLEKDFPYKEVFDCATVYLKEESSYGNLSDIIDENEMEEDGYEKFEIEKGTRIGFGEQDGTDNQGEYNDDFVIKGIIEFTKNGYYYNYDEGFICDGIITFELEKGKGYVPSQEPVDLIETDYCNGGGEKINNKSKIKKHVGLYKLNVLLAGS